MFNKEYFRLNTKNFKPLKIPKDPFNFIFKKQREVFYKFMKFEGIDFKEYNFDINCFKDQQLLKDFLQIRFIEELTEATLDIDNIDHFEEEIIDAFNFLIEAYILYGWDYKDLKPWGNYSYEYDYYNIVESVGKCCNLLKNRPWKHCQYLVDLYLFENYFKEIWNEFNVLCNFEGINQEKLFKIWSLKYQVNKFRLRTNY
jgi:hypothetical protein